MTQNLTGFPDVNDTLEVDAKGRLGVKGSNRRPFQMTALADRVQGSVSKSSIGAIGREPLETGSVAELGASLQDKLIPEIRNALSSLISRVNTLTEAMNER